MTVAEITERVLIRIDDNPAAPVSVQVGTGPTINGVVVADEVVAAIDEGQQLAALLTLCFEVTADFSLNGSCWYTPRPVLNDLIVPLKISVGGIRLRPSTLAELDAWNDAWQATAGPAARYAALGCDLLAVTPQSSASARFAYAAAPLQLGAADTPPLLEAYHPDLVEYGVYKLRLKEGAQQLTRGLGSLNAFLDSMTRLGNQVRAKAILARYDAVPFELALFDRSKLVDGILKRQRAGTKQ